MNKVTISGAKARKHIASPAALGADDNKRKTTSMRTRLCASLLAALAVGGSLCLAAQPAHADAPLVTAKGRPIPGQYIVVLKDGANADAVATHLAVRTKFVFSTALDGFTASLTRSQLARVRKDPAVKYVEQDAVVSINDKPAPPPDATAPGGLAAPAEEVTGQVTQLGATWGIDRVDQRTGVNGTYRYTNTGAGVRAYVIDTGIYTAHSQFGGRASVGFDSVGDGRNGQDCNGHGTHVAGTIGASTYGVAKAASLVAVRVLNCSGSGTFSSVIAGVDWVTFNRTGPSVANMSLGGGFSQALNDAVSKSISHGITYVVAAGNSNSNACSFSPASTPNALTVAATQLSGGSDVRAAFSNWGSCVDLFAPGVSIKSAWIGGPTATNTISGTSMASPHVAGLATLFLQANPFATPALVSDVLKSDAVAGIVTNPGGSPNLFARKWNGALSGTGASSYQPDSSFWHQGTTGYIQGWLAGTSGTDPDLYLERWNGTSWVRVAGSASVTPQERVVYNGSAGYYRFRIYAFSGGGTFDIFVNRPA